MVKIKRIILSNFNRFIKGTKRTDIDIEFPQEYSTIMIVGDNGTGKSTLASELNLLPSLGDGYDILQGETGEKIVYFTFNNEDYKVHYIYRPQGESHTCVADLAKIENGKQVQLVSSSSVTEVRNRIKQMIGLDTKLAKLTYLNSEEKGIVNMKSGARRDYMQSISPIGDTKDLVKIISEKYIHAKKTREAKEKELANLPSIDSLHMDRRNIKNQIDELTNLKNKVKAENICMSDEELEDTVNKLENLDKDFSIVCDVISAINEYKILGSLEANVSAKERELTLLEGTMSATLKNISEARVQLIQYENAQDIDTSDLKSMIDNHEFLKFTNDKKYLKSQVDLDRFVYSYNTIKEYKNSLDEVSHIISIEDVYNENKLDMDSIIALNNKLLYSVNMLEIEKEENYVSQDLLIEPPETCRDNTCRLRQEFVKMRDRVDRYENISKKLIDTKEELKKAQDKLQVSNIYNEALKTVALLKKTARDYEDVLVGIDLRKDQDDIAEDIIYNTRVYLSYKSISDRYKEATNTDFQRIKVSIDKWEKEYNELISKSQSIKDTIPKVSEDVRKSLFFGMINADLIKEKDKILQETLYLRELIAKEKEKKQEMFELETKLRDTDSKIDLLNEDLKKVDFNINLHEYIEEELKKATIDEADTEKVRETLIKHLPVKVMRRIILNLKEITNSFLELTDIPYRVHDFEITAKDFIIRVQKDNFVSEDISKMSDGEKAIMALATTLALNSVMIPNYNVFILDEMDATLSKENKRKFLDIIVNFASVKDLQVFAISHNEYFSSTEADSIGVLEMTPVGDLKVIPYLNYI
nr:MAG TPA: ATPase [Caudoviricetes sp.]